MDTLNHQLFTSTEKLPKKMLPQEHYGEKCMAHFTGRLTDLRQAVLTVGKERGADILDYYYQSLKISMSEVSE